MAQQMKHQKTSLETTDDGEDEDTQQPKIYAKNSLDRFGDDMCGLLLSYLTFEDRFSFECVSKQFRRTVFVNVVDITLSDELMQRLLNAKRSDVQMLATIAIKCPNIQCIDCRGISAEYEEHIPEVLNTFRGNCQNLKEIYCDLTSKSAQTMPSFGPLVTRIGDIDDYIDNEALTHCHRLSQLCVQSFADFTDYTFNTLFCNNLHKFVLRSHSDYNNHFWSAFVTQNQSLQCLVLESSYFEDSVSVTEMCGQLSRLSQLRELTLGLGFEVLNGQKSAVVNQCLRTIGVNCKQLKRLSFQLISEDIEPALQISLDWLRVYRQLKRLHITSYAAIDDQLLDPLRHCKRLTHLELCLLGIKPIVLKDMHQNCPRLQYLFIGNFSNITPECLSHLSRLPALQMLVIHFGCDAESVDLSDNDYSDLLSRSPKLKCIQPFYAIQSRPVVRPLSSGGLNVALAVKDPLVRTDMSAIVTAKVTG
ncbi:unnamed protein product [Medioppia subpectinata]|uniref:F-box domain-containing protein n=1 Tax=Medioppia subpectinata TaxID=1979941 RepID=A0A7R9L6Z3_9ACAR|nr:unnamed protein product [Medioppia subpectinata]CAG2116590.1 unnamed protein product [Medioppia subpectinata]